MRIGIVVPGFSADATDWCIPALRHLARTLAAEDDVRVIAVRYPYRAARYELDGCFEVLALGGARRRGIGTLGLWREALAALAVEHHRRRFDVLHAFWATESGLLAALAGRRLGIRTLVSVAGGELVALPDIGYGDQLVAWERLKIATSLRLATAISAGSCQLLEQLRRRVAHGRAYRLPLGVDTALFHAEDTRDRARARRLLHVGALVPVKDQQLLLRAIAQVPDARLEVAGEGPLLGSLQQLATSLGVADRVCFRGAVDHAALASRYRGADACVVSSRHEAQCMVALEAAACGIPVVGTSVGVLPELTVAGGRAVPVGDADGLAEAISSALAHGKAVGGSLAAFVEREFCLEACAQRFRSVYAALARG